MKPNVSPPLVWKNLTIETGAALARLRQHLASASDTPGLDAQVLLAHILGRQRSWLLAHPEAPLTASQSAQLEADEARLIRGEPLPYVLGQWSFFGLDFLVSRQVLIPRPETELLVETALDWLRSHPAARRVADIGTGTGCIAIALAASVRGLQVLAGDISAAALRVAQQNASRLGVAEQVHLFQGDLLAPSSGPFDLVCANLPYIPSATLAGLPVRLHEPTLALDGGPDGLALTGRLLEQARTRLARGGLILLEIESTCGPAAWQQAGTIFPQAHIRLLKDLNGLERLVCIEGRYPDA